MIKKTTLTFDYLDVDDLHTIPLLDLSQYHENPDSPVFIVKTPGIESSVKVPYNPNKLNILNSHILGLTLHNGDFAILQDGVYEITQAICPYESVNYTKFIFRDSTLKQILYKNLEQKTICCDCPDSAVIESKVSKINFLLASAKANAVFGKKDIATELYQKALKIVNSLTD
jgi:hypothetical protein